MKEIVEETKIYTVYTIEGVDEEHEVLAHPHNPRQCLASRRAIATGVFEDLPNALHLSQTQAEELMATSEWTEGGVVSKYKWRLNFGTGSPTRTSHVNFDSEWNPTGDYTIKMTAKGYGMLFSYNNNKPYMEIKENGSVQFRGLLDLDLPAGSVDTNALVNGVLQRRGSTVSLYVNGEKVAEEEGLTTSNGITRLGEPFGSATQWSDTMYDVELIDDEVPSNSRHYPLTLETDEDVAPTTTDVECLISDNHATAYNMNPMWIKM